MTVRFPASFLVREFFRKPKAIHADLDIAQGNRKAVTLCLETNGMKVHATTGQKPFEAFKEIEKATMIPLPLHLVEIRTGKQAKVNAGQFIQFQKRFSSVRAGEIPIVPCFSPGASPGIQ